MANIFTAATKFGARLYVYRCVSVHRGVPALGGTCSGGVPGPGKGTWSQGGPALGRSGPGGVPALGEGCLVETPPTRMATAAGDAHPTTVESIWGKLNWHPTLKQPKTMWAKKKNRELGDSDRNAHPWGQACRPVTAESPAIPRSFSQRLRRLSTSYWWTAKVLRSLFIPLPGPHW